VLGDVSDIVVLNKPEFHVNLLGGQPALIGGSPQ
jgi:hypothetical protein